MILIQSRHFHEGHVQTPQSNNHMLHVQETDMENKFDNLETSGEFVLGLVRTTFSSENGKTFVSFLVSIYTTMVLDHSTSQTVEYITVSEHYVLKLHASRAKTVRV